LVNLQENELDIVATFLGHNIRVHREYYRLPNSSLQLAKVGKMITSKEKGIILPSDFDIESEENLYVSEEEGDESDNEENDNFEAIEEEKRNHERAERIEETISVEEQNLMCTIPQENLPIVRSSIQRKSTLQNKQSAKKILKRNVSGVGVMVPAKKMKESQSKKQVRIPWSKKEINVLLTFFKNYKSVQFLPHKKDFIKCMEDNPSIFSQRTWTNLKDRLRHYQKFGK